MTRSRSWLGNAGRLSLFLTLAASASVGGCAAEHFGTVSTKALGPDAGADEPDPVSTSTSKGPVASARDGGSSSIVMGSRVDAGAPTTRPGGISSGAITGTCKAALPTGFCFAGDRDDFISGGKPVSIPGTTGKVQVGSNDAVQVDAALTGQGSWTAEFAPAEGEYWQPRSFDPAERYPFMTFGAAGLSISGEGRGCNMLTGSFDVSEVEFDHTGQVVRFAATFVQHCEGGTSGLRGAINYQANGIADAPTEDPSVCTVAGDTGFCMTSPYGRSADPGRTISGTPADGTFTLTETNGLLQAAFVGGSASSWRQSFKGPGMQALSVGSYAHAQSYPGNSPTAPGISIDGCTPMDASFEVLALTRDPMTQEVTVAAIDFEAQCLAAPSPPTKGKLRLHSVLP